MLIVGIFFVSCEVPMKQVNRHREFIGRARALLKTLENTIDQALVAYLVWIFEQQILEVSPARFYDYFKDYVIEAMTYLHKPSSREYELFSHAISSHLSGKRMPLLTSIVSEEPCDRMIVIEKIRYLLTQILGKRWSSIATEIGMMFLAEDIAIDHRIRRFRCVVYRGGLSKMVASGSYIECVFGATTLSSKQESDRIFTVFKRNDRSMILQTEDGDPIGITTVFLDDCLHASFTECIEMFEEVIQGWQQTPPSHLIG